MTLFEGNTNLMMETCSELNNLQINLKSAVSGTCMVVFKQLFRNPDLAKTFKTFLTKLPHSKLTLTLPTATTALTFGLNF